MKNSNNKKRLIIGLIFSVLFVTTVVVIIILWTKSNVTSIKQSEFKTIISDSARANFDDNEDEMPSYKGTTIEKFTLNISVGNNTTILTGVIILEDNKKVSYKSEWSRNVYDHFNSQANYYIGPNWSSKLPGDRYPHSTSQLSGDFYASIPIKPVPKNNTSDLGEAQFFYKANNKIKTPPIYGAVNTSDRAYVSPVLSFFASFMPILLLILFSVWLFARMSKMQGGGLNPFNTKSKARLSASNITFQDVAGINDEKAELLELVDYLKNPKKYTQHGARAPKGILLEGPPGTGKTLLARALAGEAGVPFFSISGAEFEEVFVGLGASRMRSMFENAKKNAPSLVFIDEIDAIGRERSVIRTTTNDQTLNQLLTELDGFSVNSGVIIIGATNLADSLDKALLRPGRLDRKITLTLPTIKERRDILKLHAKNKNISSAIDFENIAQKTPGFSGAQLDNVLNEAAILSVRYNTKIITPKIINEAIDRVIGGPAKTSREYSTRDKKIVSFHEAGHAVVGLKVKHAARVEKVTIIPRGQAGGYSILLPKEETIFYSKEQILSSIAGFLGGRASEAIIFGDNNITTGAHDDLGKATALARRLVAEYGMSKEIGYAQYEPPNKKTTNIDRTYSDEVAQKIDVAVKNVLDEGYKTAYQVISTNKNLLHLIAEALCLLETIMHEDVLYIDKHKKLPPRFIEEQERQKQQKKKKTKSDKTQDDDEDVIEVTPQQS